jgi:hypothetical protein
LATLTPRVRCPMVRLPRWRLKSGRLREAIDLAAPGGGYILASDHSRHDGIPVENIVELFRVGREYGGSFYMGPGSVQSRLTGSAAVARLGNRGYG